MSWELALQNCQENLEPRHLFPLLCASPGILKRLTISQRLRVSHVTSRVALSAHWPHRICPSCIETVVLQSAAPRSFYDSLPKLRNISWCMANPIWSSDLPRASPIFMLPGLPRMMLILDLVRRRQTTFVALTLERLDHGGGSLPMFISMSLRKQLHSSEPEFGACKHALGTQVSRKDVEGALTLAKLDSLHHNEAINVIFPNEVPSDTGIEKFTEMIEAGRWEVTFSAVRASEEELGCLQVNSNSASWRVGNCLKVLEAGGVNCEPFALLGLRGFWTMELKGGTPTTPNLLSLWPPPCGPRPHGSILYQLEMGSSQTLAQCTLSPGLEATFPFDPQKVVDADGMLQVHLKLLNTERVEGLAVFPDGENSCTIFWRLAKVHRFLDASEVILSSPLFKLRGTDGGWEGCLLLEAERNQPLKLQLRLILPAQTIPLAKLAGCAWREATPGEQDGRKLFRFGPFESLKDARDECDALLVMVRLPGVGADNIKVRQ